MRRCQVVVVGAGAMGSATAWHLARRGVDVVLVEQYEPGHGRGSSHGASRIFRFAYPHPAYVAMAQAALPLWRELEEDAGAVLLEVTGGIDIGDDNDLVPIEDSLLRQGAKVERLHERDVAERWPGLAVGDDEVILHSPDAGRIWADRTVAALQRRARDHGAEVRFGERVQAVAQGGFVSTDAEEYEADVVVLTAGPWLGPLVESSGLDVELPALTVTREQTFHFAPLDDDIAWPSFIHHRPGGPSVYGLETPGEGLKVAEHHSGPETDAEGRSFAIDEIGRRRLIRYVTERVPGVDPTPVSELTCLYTNTDDETFVLSRHGRVVVGSACSGHGFKFTPLIGQRLAQLCSPST